MYLAKLSEFVEFLSIKDQSLEQILAHLTLRVLSPLNVCTTFICELNDDNLIETLGVYGVDKGLKIEYPDLYSFNEKLPVPDAMRNRKVVWINGLPEWPNEYPALKDMPPVGSAKTFVCFPIEKSGTPVAAFGIFCVSEIEPSSEVESFLRAIGYVISLHLYQSKISIGSNNTKGKQTGVMPAVSIEHKEMTDRQLLILKMMSEGRTNIVISELLGYSESTVRQETIKIFAKLGCSGREEASVIYREKLEKTA
jgi:DNA-binding CsgD family transcriptional regulator